MQLFFTLLSKKVRALFAERDTLLLSLQSRVLLARHFFLTACPSQLSWAFLKPKLAKQSGSWLGPASETFSLAQRIKYNKVGPKTPRKADQAETDQNWNLVHNQTWSRIVIRLSHVWWMNCFLDSWFACKLHVLIPENKIILCCWQVSVESSRPPSAWLAVFSFYWHMTWE